MKKYLLLFLLLCSLCYARSSHWPGVQKAYLKSHAKCEVCGSSKALNVHHVIPVHIDASKELLPENLITLCRDCHYRYGHAGLSWKFYNENIKTDAKALYEIITRIKLNAKKGN